MIPTVPAKTIVTRNKTTAWFGCEYNMNIYRGCCHGCLYCDSRSDCYHVDNFDTVHAKQDALRIIRDDLARRVKTGVVATGSMSDPYNPFEKKEELTRHALELVDAYGYGVAIATKGDLITRDIDVLQSIKKQAPALCKITVTCIEDALAAKLEPHAPSPTRRLAAIQKLAKAGLFSGVLLMPVMPFIQDTPENILSVVEQAAENGARFVYPGFGVTARSGQREYMLAELEKAFPGQGLAEKYRSRFGSRYHCTSPHAKKLWELFVKACDEKGLLYRMQDIIRAYRQGYGSSQLSFL